MSPVRGDTLRMITTGRQATPQERVAASRLILRHARNRDDLRLLLEALGLNRPAA